MALTQKDLEQIERVIYKNGDDICVSIARAFERLEERLVAMESRVYKFIDEGVTDMCVAQRGTEEKFAALDKAITGQILDVNERLNDLLNG